MTRSGMSLLRSGDFCVQAWVVVARLRGCLRGEEHKARTGRSCDGMHNDETGETKAICDHSDEHCWIKMMRTRSSGLSLRLQHEEMISFDSFPPRQRDEKTGGLSERPTKGTCTVLGQLQARTMLHVPFERYLRVPFKVEGHSLDRQIISNRQRSEEPNHQSRRPMKRSQQCFVQLIVLH